jgi:hypothetical protein
MSITPYLDDFDADPETKRVLDVALEMTRVRLELDHFANGIIAKQIIELVTSFSFRWAVFAASSSDGSCKSAVSSCAR